MKRAYRRGSAPASRHAADEVRIVERPALATGNVAVGNVSVELPVSLAAAVEGVTAEIEQLAGQAGMLIMRAVMDAEVEQLAGPRGRGLSLPDKGTNRSGRRVAGASRRVTPSKAASRLGGKKVKLARPRVRDEAGREVGLRTYATNLIESALSVVRTTTRRVKRWRQGDMRLRWSAAALLAAETRFRRVRDYQSMEGLLASVNAFDAKLAGKSQAA